MNARDIDMKVKDKDGEYEFTMVHVPTKKYVTYTAKNAKHFTTQHKTNVKITVLKKLMELVEE